MMDSKEIFFKTILAHYNKISSDKISKELLIEMSQRLTDYYYEQYNRFRIFHPKSINSYSSFQIKDLEHPQTYELIIKFFKEKLGNNYAEISMTMLNMNENELKKFERNREDFHKMW